MKNHKNLISLDLERENSEKSPDFDNRNKTPKHPIQKLSMGDCRPGVNSVQWEESCSKKTL